MAFRIPTTLYGYNFRGCRQGVSTKTGKPFWTLNLESPEADGNIEVSVTDPNLFHPCSLLAKNDVADFPIVACAMANGRSFVTLTAAPENVMRGGE